ncbi:hypothetical protein GQ53DRAFT_838016 [Thozetella sp. PMI_491]|nr:hypothetical protein GQ53DRAFT_838016 [Thozetella sp. PMI_491]
MAAEPLETRNTAAFDTEAGSPTSAARPLGKKKYVTRACDACKKRKSKCDGREVQCAYKSAYNRVQKRQKTRRVSITTTSTDTVRSGATAQRPSTSNTHVDEPASGEDDPEVIDDTTIRVDAEDSSDASKADHHSDVVVSGDASAHGFLQRISSHLALVGQGLPRNLFKREEQKVGKLGDAGIYLLPSIEAARSYVSCFFDHASVTYRYLVRTETLELVEKAYSDDEAFRQDHIKMAKLLMVMGVGCIWMASWKNQPLINYKLKTYKLYQAAVSRLDQAQGTYPPPLELVQTHTTSHFTFCAVSILLVYMTMYPHSDEHATIEPILEQAMKGHRKLVGSADPAAQKLLEESRLRARSFRNTTLSGSVGEGQPNIPNNAWSATEDSHQFPEAIIEERTGDPSHESERHQDMGGSMDSQSVPILWPEGIAGLELGPDLARHDLSEEIDPLGVIMDIGFDSTAWLDSLGPGTEQWF